VTLAPLPLGAPHRSSRKSWRNILWRSIDLAPRRDARVLGSERLPRSWHDGTAAVQRLRAARTAPAQRALRATTVRTHLLWWLDAQDTPPADVTGALVGLDADELGTPFTLRTSAARRLI
jgi:hypothetical protein